MSVDVRGRRRWTMRGRKGQGLLEFALLLPVLLLIILGIIEAALLVQGYLTVQHAAREAARFAVTYQPVRGQKLDGNMCEATTVQGPPFSDPARVCNLYEDKDEYHSRRVALIKQEARRAAAGLRINDDHLGVTESAFHLYKDEPAFFGVRVWGFPSFDADCNADPDSCLDHPGIEGLPVRVLVLHNVQTLDPLYQAIAEFVPVRADTQMINEGIQAGKSNQLPGSFDTIGYIEETAPPTATRPPSPTPTFTPTPTQTLTATPTATPPPPLYRIDLSESATNQLPDDRKHEFVATVTDQLGEPVGDADVSFLTDKGGFTYSGVGSKYVVVGADAGGQASVTLYGNQPGTATIRAWLDYDDDGVWDDGYEPVDASQKTWEVSGPYISVSDHEVIPQQSISIDVVDHDPDGNPYRLLWCLASSVGAVPQAVVRETLDVDAGTWEVAGIGFDVPIGSQGEYQIESHSDGGDCGSGDLAARSAIIRVPRVDPEESVSIRGDTWVLASGTVWTFPGVDVWATGPDGDIYHATAGEGGAFEFQYLPPGTYRIDAEIWIGDWLRFATTTLEAVEGDYSVHLFLL
jgi:hypothetical protein